MDTTKETKRLTRLSFLYPLSYLIPCSLVLIFAPKFLLDNFSNGNYSIYMTRLAGAAMLGFTIMVFSVFYYKVEAIYDVVIFVRLPVMAVVTWLYIDTKDPFFMILLVTVLPGVILSTIAKMRDKKRNS